MQHGTHFGWRVRQQDGGECREHAFAQHALHGGVAALPQHQHCLPPVFAALLHQATRRVGIEHHNLRIISAHGFAQDPARDIARNRTQPPVRRQERSGIVARQYHIGRAQTLQQMRVIGAGGHQLVHIGGGFLHGGGDGAKPREMAEAAAVNGVVENAHLANLGSEPNVAKQIHGRSALRQHLLINPVHPCRDIRPSAARL